MTIVFLDTPSACCGVHHSLRYQLACGTSNVPATFDVAAVVKMVIEN